MGERLSSGLQRVAVVVDAGLAVAGLWLELRPRMRSDVWAGAALILASVMNANAMLLDADDPRRARLRRRSRRIAVLANAGLAIAGLLFAGAILRRGGVTAAEAAAAALLFCSPLAILAAILFPPRRAAPTSERHTG